ncbi:hypothetical protein BDB00DRAFT_209479 [Zychaea mexicana]|uniref:uncharacterized protein n=1 Tax=Zychaea mexicana TaxID=64656 RepID=UPI0022FEE955|nr:uncharacterized protein BDB00DRAFT_209479 [Zychaea mexicana]KAI9495662.1 hypothetical protein BDB00DRAFT_209479 [Zychaea mexicana]
MATTITDITSSSFRNHSSLSSSSQRLSWSPNSMVYDERRNHSLPMKLNNPDSPQHQHCHRHGDCGISSGIPSLSPTAKEDTLSCNTATSEKYDRSEKAAAQEERSRGLRHRIPNIYVKCSQSLLLENTASVARDHLGTFKGRKRKRERER